MEFFEAVSTRRSVRKYHATKVPDEVINKALDAALLAPNSSTMQAWEFYWVRSAEKKTALVDACFGQPAASTAAELVVAIARCDTWRRNRQLMLAELKNAKGVPKTALDYYEKLIPVAYIQGWFSEVGFLKRVIIDTIGLFRPMPRGPYSRGGQFSVLSKSTALACENFMLAIAAQGYGTCPMEGLDEYRVKRILGLGRDARVVMCISVGEPDKDGIYGKRIRFDRNLFIKEV